MNHTADTIDTLIKPVQTKLGIAADGVDGPVTWRAIATALGVGAQQASPTPTAPAEVPLGMLTRGGVYTGIIDVNHANAIDLGKLLDAGFGAIIHKASEGTQFVDPKYTARKSAAMSAGILWGAYHFAAFGDGTEQARHFLAVEDGSNPKVLLCLDFEPSSHGPNMTLQQGRDFLSYVRAKTGRWPLVYGGGGLLRDLLETKHDDVFANCRLWLCDMRAHPQPILPMWPKWTLLQYTDGQLGQEPKDVPGSDGADRNSFAGNLEELKKLWPFSSSGASAACSL